MVPLNVRTVTCDPPRPRLNRIECVAEAIGRTEVNPFSIGPTTLESANTPDAFCGRRRSTPPL
jgi:hypothetical protein